MRACKPVSTPVAPIPAPGTDPAAAWARTRALGDIQFVPLDPPKTPPPHRSAWFDWLTNWLNAHLSPFGQWLARHWVDVEWSVAAGVVLVALWLGWRLWRDRRPRLPSAEAPAWRPDAAHAHALLADADALAAAGRFADAVHLLLRRSFDDIAATRPDWLTPASTAREIAGLPALPGPARAAFAVIAGEVERSRYALLPIGAPDWARARAAYAQFAVPGRAAS